MSLDPVTLDYIVIHEFSALCRLYGLPFTPVSRHLLLFTRAVKTFKAMTDQKIHEKRGYTSPEEYIQTVFQLNLNVVYSSATTYEVTPCL